MSDTHGYLDDSIIKHASSADEIWHAGDIGTVDITDRLKNISSVKAVYGNIDGHEVRLEYPKYLSFISEGVKVLITHIGGYPGRYVPEAKVKILDERPDLFICGHSHILKVMRDPQLKLLHMNPGAAGTHGFHKARTMIRFKVADGKIKELDVIELGSRSALP